MELFFVLWLFLAVAVAFDSTSNHIPTSADISYSEIHSFYWALAFFLFGLLPLFFYLPTRSKVMNKRIAKKQARKVDIEDYGDFEERLKTLASLRLQDLITEEEYQARRKAIVDRL